MHGLRLADEADVDRAELYRPRPANVYLSELRKGPAAYHRKRRDRGLGKAEEAKVMYQREECLIHASICREKAQADPARSDHWIDRAITWHQRAAQSRHGNAITHEVHDGRLISKPAK
jgi:hypothetical protein